MRIPVMLTALATLAACAPPVPEAREQGVGFGDRTAAITFHDPGGPPALVGPLVAGGEISDEVIPGQPTETASNLPPVEIDTNNPGISDSQDFDAVASRESIESDRARLEAQREAFQVIQPGALPQRQGSSGPSIVEFALSTTHPVGQPVYGRSGFSGQNRFNRNCAKYESSDLAQIAFLEAGGPERDRMGIDPDGDGYACFWDPRPFRAAVGR